MHLVGRMHVMNVATISTGTSYLKDSIIESNSIDEHYQQVRYGLQQQEVLQKFDKYQLGESGTLMHNDKVYVPRFGEIRNMVLNGCIMYLMLGVRVIKRQYQL